VEDDFTTCMQVVVYAWLCEQAGIDIKNCEYRYIRKDRTVTCRYDDDMREELSSFLSELKAAIENNDFPRNENEISCKYCGMADICEWPETAKGKEDGSCE
jgi:CRISPR/Cas system-associated exonuclease Cas4 (RecB family)